MFKSCDDTLPGYSINDLGVDDVMGCGLRSLDSDIRGEFDGNVVPPPPLSMCKRGGLDDDRMAEGDTYRSVDAMAFNEFDDHEIAVRHVPAKLDSWSRPSLPTKTLTKTLDSDFSSPGFASFGSSFGFGVDLPSSTRAALRPVPAFYAKNSSFVATSSPHDLLLALEGILERADDVDHVSSETKYKIKGIIRVNLESCPFVVKLYDNGQHNGQMETLVELQNRGGCVVAFSTFYRLTLTQLSELSPTYFVRRASSPQGTTDSVSSNAAPARRLDVLPPPPDSEEDEEEFKTGCEFAEDYESCMVGLVMRLCEEVESKFVDVQREAWRSLANITSESCVSRQKLDFLSPVVQHVLEALSIALRSPDEVVLNYACTLLVNVCTVCSAHREGICNDMLSLLFDVLDSPGSLSNRNCKRRVAEAFELLSGQTDSLQKLKELSTSRMNTLRKYSSGKYHDRHLRENIATTLQRVEA